MKEKVDPISQKRHFTYQLYLSLIKSYPCFTKTDILQLLFQKLLELFETDYESLQQLFGMFIFDYYVSQKLIDDSDLIFVIEDTMNLDFMCDFLLDPDHISFFITLLYHIVDDYDDDICYEEIDFSFCEFPEEMQHILETYHPDCDEISTGLEQFHKIQDLITTYSTEHLMDLFNYHTYLSLLQSDQEAVFYELYDRIVFPDDQNISLLTELSLFYYSLKKNEESLEKISEIDRELLSLFENHSKSEIVSFLSNYDHMNYLFYMLVTFLQKYEGLETVPSYIEKTEEYVKTLKKKFEDDISYY